MPAIVLPNAPEDNSINQFAALGQFIMGMQNQKIQNENLKAELNIKLQQLDSLKSMTPIRAQMAQADLIKAQADATKATSDASLAPAESAARIGETQARSRSLNQQTDLYAQSLADEKAAAPVKLQLQQEMLKKAQLDYTEAVAGTGLAAINKQKAAADVDKLLADAKLTDETTKHFQLQNEIADSMKGIAMFSRLKEDPALLAAAKKDPGILGTLAPDSLKQALTTLPDSAFLQPKDYKEFAMQQKDLGNPGPYQDWLRAEMAPQLIHAASQMTIGPDGKTPVSGVQNVQTALDKMMDQVKVEAAQSLQRNSGGKKATTQPGGTDTSSTSIKSINQFTPDWKPSQVDATAENTLPPIFNRVRWHYNSAPANIANAQPGTLVGNKAAIAERAQEKNPLFNQPGKTADLFYATDFTGTMGNTEEEKARGKLYDTSFKLEDTQGSVAQNAMYKTLVSELFTSKDPSTLVDNFLKAYPKALTSTQQQQIGKILDYEE